MQRVMAFLPVFFMGYYSVKTDIKRLANKIPLLGAVGILLSAFFILYFFANENISWFTTCKESYWSIPSMSPVLRCMARCLFFVSATVIALSVIRLVPVSASLSKWGLSTLFIYMYHTFAVTALRCYFEKGYLQSNEILLVAFSLLTTFGLVYLSRFKMLKILMNPVSYFRDRG